MNYYDLYLQDEFIGKYTAREAAQIVGCSNDTIRAALRKQKLIQCKYRVENGVPENFEKKWIEACNRIKRIAGVPIKGEKRGRYVLLHDGERVKGILTSKQVSEICGCPVNSVGTYASHDYFYKKHWRILRKEDYEAFLEMQKK